MSASICFNILLSLCVHPSAIDYNLWPAMRIHRSISGFKWQIPDHPVRCWVSIRTLKSMLTSPAFWIFTTCQTPVWSRHECVLYSKSVHIHKVSILDLACNGNIEVTVSLGWRVKRLGIVVKLIHVLIFELIRVIFVILNVLKIRIFWAHIVCFKVASFHF